jgi:hypothetical protein
MKSCNANTSPKRGKNQKPYAMVGAGNLVSKIWKTGDEHSGWRYCFNIFRITRRGVVDQRFSPGDVVSLMKLTRVLAATLSEDGCLTSALRDELGSLADDLRHISGNEE